MYIITWTWNTFTSDFLQVTGQVVPSQTVCPQRRSWQCLTASHQSHNQGPLHRLKWDKTRGKRCQTSFTMILNTKSVQIRAAAMPWWDYLYLRWPAQPPWGSLSPLLSHWRWPRDAPGAPGTAGYSGTQKPWGSSRMWSKRLLSDKRAGFKSKSISVFRWWRTCRPDGTRGSGRRRDRLRSERGHSPPQHCWGALQHGRTFLSSGPASACRGQCNRSKKLTKGRHIFSVCADAWIKTGYRDRAGIKCIIADKKPPHLSFSRVQ